MWVCVGVMFRVVSSQSTLTTHHHAHTHTHTQGCEIVTPALSFATVVAPIEQLGFKPVFCDVELGEYVPSIESVVAKITDKTKCLFIPNLVGGKIDWAALKEKVHGEMKRSDIVLFEDSCDTMTHTEVYLYVPNTHYPQRTQPKQNVTTDNGNK